jgi:hypothetical protein
VEEPVVLTPLPCGKLVNLHIGDCCLINCPDPEIRKVTPLNARCRAIDACKHWKGVGVLKPAN